MALKLWNLNIHLTSDEVCTMISNYDKTHAHSISLISCEIFSKLNSKPMTPVVDALF